MEKYIRLAKELKMADAIVITPRQVCFDRRTQIKCRWGCDYKGLDNLKCGDRGTTYEERVEMIRSYTHILFIHSHNARDLTRAVLEIERAAFLDGNYFAGAIRGCNYCENCHIKKGKECPHPEKIRPCDSLFGIDMYKTASQLGYPCQVLQKKEEQQDRYGLVLID